MMSTSIQNAASNTSEHTPLLSGQDHGSHGEGAQDIPQPQNTYDEENEDEADVTDILTRRSRILLLLLLFATFLLSLLFTGLSITAFFMLRYGKDQFGILDYQLNGAVIAYIIITGIFGITHALYNIIRLVRFNLTKLPSKRLLAIACACISLAIAFGLAPYYLDLDNWWCNQDRLNGPWYPGTWEQCKRWETIFLPVTFTLVVSLGLNSILLFALVFFAFSIARSRSTEDPIRNPNWTFAPGYFSFEFNVQWGAGNPHRQRQEQTQSTGDVTEQGAERRQGVIGDT